MGVLRLEVRTVAPRSANVVEGEKFITESVVLGAVRLLEGDNDHPASGEVNVEVPAGNFTAGQLVDASLSAPFDAPVPEPAPPVALPDETPPAEVEVPEPSTEAGSIEPAPAVPAETDAGTTPPEPTPEDEAAIDADQEARIAALEAEEKREAEEGTP